MGRGSGEVEEQRAAVLTCPSCRRAALATVEQLTSRGDLPARADHDGLVDYELARSGIGIDCCTETVSVFCRACGMHWSEPDFALLIDPGTRVDNRPCEQLA
jgi:hypothetical protein